MQGTVNPHNQEFRHRNPTYPNMEIHVTDEARERLEEQTEGRYVLISAEPGGCAGLHYGMSVHDAAGDEHEIVESDGLFFLVDANHVPLFDGITIEWQDTMLGGGFTIDNPNAQSSCGCGKSFDPED